MKTFFYSLLKTTNTTFILATTFVLLETIFLSPKNQNIALIKTKTETFSNPLATKKAGHMPAYSFLSLTPTKEQGIYKTQNNFPSWGTPTKPTYIKPSSLDSNPNLLFMFIAKIHSINDTYINTNPKYATLTALILASHFILFILYRIAVQINSKTKSKRYQEKILAQDKKIKDLEDENQELIKNFYQLEATVSSIFKDEDGHSSKLHSEYENITQTLKQAHKNIKTQESQKESIKQGLKKLDPYLLASKNQAKLKTNLESTTSQERTQAIIQEFSETASHALSQSKIIYDTLGIEHKDKNYSTIKGAMYEIQTAQKVLENQLSQTDFNTTPRVDYRGIIKGYKDTQVDLVIHDQEMILFIQCKFRTPSINRNHKIHPKDIIRFTEGVKKVEIENPAYNRENFKYYKLLYVVPSEDTLTPEAKSYLNIHRESTGEFIYEEISPYKYS